MSEMSDADEGRRERDAAIVKAHGEGVPVAALAERYGVSERHARRIATRPTPGRRAVVPRAEELEPVDVSRFDPALELGALLAQLRWTEEELRSLASTTKNDAVRVAALRSHASVARDRFSLTRERLAVFQTVGEVESFMHVALSVLAEETRRLGLSKTEMAERMNGEIRARGAGILGASGLTFEGFAVAADGVKR